MNRNMHKSISQSWRSLNLFFFGVLFWQLYDFRPAIIPLASATAVKLQVGGSGGEGEQGDFGKKTPCKEGTNK